MDRLAEVNELLKLESKVDSLNKVSSDLDSKVKDKDKLLKKLNSSFTPEEEEAVKSTYDNMVSLINSSEFLDKQIKDNSDKYDTKTREGIILDKSHKFFSYALEKITLQYIEKLEKILNEVYFYVYMNKTKKIKLSVEDFRNKKIIKLRIIQNVDEIDYEEEIEEEGFSVKVVLGTIFMLYFIIYNKLPRIIIFDESFSGLSDVTLDRFIPMLKIFIDKANFKFLCVTHDPRLVKFADKLYKVENGVYTLDNISEVKE